MAWKNRANRFVSDRFAEAKSVTGRSVKKTVSTDPARKFTVDFYRTGYYGGKGGRHMLRLGPFQGQPQ